MNPIDLLGKTIEVSHSNLEITSRISTILNLIAQELRFEEAIVFTHDKDKRLTCRYVNRKSSLFKVLSPYRCHVGEGVIGTVAQNRMPQFFTHKNVPPRFGCLFYAELDGAIEKHRVFSFLPLSDDSYLYGVLVLCSSARDLIQDSEKIILSIISREIGGVLSANELLISSKKRISELATLSELGKILTSSAEPRPLMKSIGLIVAKALNATFVTIKLETGFLRFNGQRFTYGEVDPSIQGHVDQLEKVAVESKAMASLKDQPLGQDGAVQGLSMYSTPIISRNRMLGTITICGRRSDKGPVLEENGQYLVNTIANYITNGLENTLLNSKLKDLMQELNDTQRRIVEQEKLRSLGEMTANIAHEIKNPLVIIGGFTKRLAKKFRLDQEENRYVDIITNEVYRLETILNEILDYVKESLVPREPCNMNDCLDEVLFLFASDRTWERVNIVKEYEKDLPQAVCDIHQMKQVFINIIMNAYEAMHGAGRIVVKTAQTPWRGRSFLLVSIADSGGGIDPAVIDDVFNPFFTTKEKGTGLGLAISNKIILSHGGRIEVKNQVGKGATFFVYLPLKNDIIKEELL
jgi:nitrogen-specific signal transduction histidine kinase